MKYKYVFFIGFLVAASLLYTWSESVRPQPVDWSETYLPEEKNPYDTYIAYHNLASLFPSSKVELSRRSLVAQLEELKDKRTVNYIFVNRSFSAGMLDVPALLRFVARGNSLFVAAEILPDSLVSSLGLQMKSSSVIRKHRFTHPGLAAVEYDFGNLGREYFELPIGFAGKVLGTVSENRYPDFVSVPYGEGQVYLNLNPKAFTNYWLLDSAGGDYHYKALSYLPDEGNRVIWDTSQTLGLGGEASLFRVLLRYPAMRWAFYLLLVGGVLYALFCMKREQRPVPEIVPYENKMLDFVASVSSLYYKQKDHSRIAEKRIDFFLERVRFHYKIRTDELDAYFIELLAGYSGKSREQVKGLVDMICGIRKNKNADEQTLRDLVKEIDGFSFPDLK